MNTRPSSTRSQLAPSPAGPAKKRSPTVAREKPLSRNSERARSGGSSPPLAAKDHAIHHKDGSLWACGKMLNAEMVGYWKWFRKDGTKLRSGYFDQGRQCGEWITYDKTGQIYKVTAFNSKARKPSTR